MHVEGNGGHAKFWLDGSRLQETTSIEARLTRPALAADVRVSDARLTVVLTDGREISVPLTEFAELAAATPEQRANWRITALGTAIYWPDIDEEFGLAGMLGISESALEEAAGFETHDLEARAE